MSKFYSFALYMGFLRFFSGILEITAGLFMLYFQDVKIALKINALLALIGPLIMLCVTSLGLIGVAENVSTEKILPILAGVILIFWGINKL